MTDRAGLTGEAAADNGALDVELIGGIGGLQRLTNSSMERPLMVMEPVPFS